jgi:ABC-type proline/glycine betaine transport system permease subunit
MIEKFGYAVAVLLAAIGLAAAVIEFISEPDYPLTGVPFAVVMCIVALVAWRAVKKGHAVMVILSPFVLIAYVIWRTCSEHSCF